MRDGFFQLLARSGLLLLGTGVLLVVMGLGRVGGVP